MNLSSVDQIVSSVDAYYDSFNTDWQLVSRTTVDASKGNLLHILCDKLGLDKEFSQSQDRAKDNVYKNEEKPAERSANRRQVTVKRIKERRKIYPTK